MKSSLIPLLFSVLLLGCASVVPSAPAVLRTEPELSFVAPRPLPAAAATIGTSVEGRPVELIRRGSGPDVILIVATIHGDESAGTPLVYALLDWLDDRPDVVDGRTVCIVPVANPDGFAAGRRTNVRGVDLNRNFPADNRIDRDRFGLAALTEPEAAALATLVEDERPTRVVSLHEPVGCIDWDGPGADLARAMADACGLPANKLGARPGSMGAWVGETLGIPIITFELPRAAADLTADELWERYGTALQRAVTWPDDPGFP